jgi:hypothetical protein
MRMGQRAKGPTGQGLGFWEALGHVPPCPSRRPLGALVGRVKSPRIRLYQPPPPHGGEFDTSGLREFLEELSSPLPYAPPLFLSSSWLSSHVWSCASELEETPHTGRHRAPGFLVQILLLPLLCWTGVRTTSIHRMCVIPQRCCTCGTMSLRRHCRTGIVVPCIC